MKKIRFWKTKEKPFNALDNRTIHAIPDNVKSDSIKAYRGASEHNYTPIIRRNYTGEKNYGELGSAISYYMDYYILALRSWQAYIESDVAKMVIDNWVLWKIGKGLRLSSEPQLTVLASENVTVSEADAAEFSKIVESRFNLHAKSRFSSYNRLKSLNNLQKVVEKNSVIAGDCLVVQRYYDDGGVNVQVIDGMNVISPLAGDGHYANAKKRGNTIELGIELNSRGGHVAYFVKATDTFKVDRIPARGAATGRTVAYMVYGSEYRLGYSRGMPLIGVMLETIKKMDRYKEAAVGSAEERQKITFFIEHILGSDGENPMLQQMFNAPDLTAGDGNDKNTVKYAASNEDATKMAVTTEKTVLNMPVGSTIKALASDNEMNVGAFMDSNVKYVCAAIGIPFEVAMQKYESNYSSSRMAVKSWEFRLRVEREDFAEQFCQPFYNFWLTMEILTGKVSAPGFIDNMGLANKMVILAYQNARFLGANVPHVDPQKEVKAELLKLGDNSLPISTHRQVSENLGDGEFSANISTYRAEVAENKDLVKDDTEPVVVSK